MNGRVSYLGPEGSYTYLAARAMCGEAELVPCPTFSAALRALSEGKTDACVLPIENTINGGVLQNMDLLACNAQLVAVKEYTLRIDHRLITLAGADRGKSTAYFRTGRRLTSVRAF